jgi:hypothetical protein
VKWLIRQRTALLLLIVGFLLTISILEAFAIPEGASSVVIVSSERRTTPTAANVTAEAGNITRLTVTANRQTAAWQGFAGNISGSIVLDDASGDRFFAWSLFNISGEIYASRNGSINFNSIYPHNNCTIDEIGMTGASNADRTNRTYNQSANTVNFSVGVIQINATSACSVRPYVNSTTPSSNLFENIILSPEHNNASPQQGNFVSGGNQSVYVGILQLGNVHGFDGQVYNFQLLVPVNRTATFNTYFFYAEVD